MLHLHSQMWERQQIHRDVTANICFSLLGGFWDTILVMNGKIDLFIYFSPIACFSKQLCQNMPLKAENCFITWIVVFKIPLLDNW